MAVRTANARWEGALREGRGTMALGSGAFEGQYSYSSRFEEGTGTNPEELIGAAHAGCFSMALAHALAEAGHEASRVETNARVQLEPTDSGPTINWPSAKPANVPVRVSCTTDEDTERSSAILGSAGRYMSIVSGPSATMTPSTTIIRVRLGVLTSTAGDIAMQVVSTLNQYFLPEPPAVTGITELSILLAAAAGTTSPGRSLINR